MSSKPVVREGRTLSHSVFAFVLQKSIPTQIRQLVLYISSNAGSVDGFVGGVTYAKRLQKHFV